MERFSSLIRAVFTRQRNRPEYLDASQLSERIRADLGLSPTLEAERLDDARQASDLRPERPACDWHSISLARRGLL